jgi:hypothetical protein
MIGVKVGAAGGRRVRQMRAAWPAGFASLISAATPSGAWRWESCGYGASGPDLVLPPTLASFADPPVGSSLLIETVSGPGPAGPRSGPLTAWVMALDQRRGRCVNTGATGVGV